MKTFKDVPPKARFVVVEPNGEPSLVWQKISTHEAAPIRRILKVLVVFTVDRMRFRSDTEIIPVNI